MYDKDTSQEGPHENGAPLKDQLPLKLKWRAKKIQSSKSNNYK